MFSASCGLRHAKGENREADVIGGPPPNIQCASQCRSLVLRKIHTTAALPRKITNEVAGMASDGEMSGGQEKTSMLRTPVVPQKPYGPGKCPL